MTQMQYIPDLVSTVVDRVKAAILKSHGFNVYYDWGNLFDIQKVLTEKDLDPRTPGKYPLVWLVTPFRERHERQDMYVSADLRFIIAHNTDTGYYMHQRRDKVFLPILYPVMQELLNQLIKSASFQVNPLLYEKEDLQLARVDEKGKHLLNDAADIIDLTVQKVLIKNKIC